MQSNKLLQLLGLLAMLLVVSSTAVEVEQSQEVEVDNEEDMEVDTSLLIALRQKLSGTLRWAIEETVKAECCSAAFALCEKPPAAANIKQDPKKLLKDAKKKCSAVYTVPLKNKEQICGFYNNPASCAYTPNVEADWTLYENGLTKCCESSKNFCTTESVVDLYYAKRDCIGFALRTDSQLCEQAESSDCKA